MACAPPMRATRVTPRTPAAARSAAFDRGHATWIWRTPRHLGRDNGHHEGGKERKLPARDVAADGIDGTHQLADFHTRFDFHRPRSRQLLFRDRGRWKSNLVKIGQLVRPIDSIGCY